MLIDKGIRNPGVDAIVVEKENAVGTPILYCATHESKGETFVAKGINERKCWNERS